MIEPEEAFTEFKNLEQLEEERINQILDKVDVDKNGTIEYSEFLAHSLTSK